MDPITEMMLEDQRESQQEQLAERFAIEQLGHAYDNTPLISEHVIAHIAKELQMDEKSRSRRLMYKSSPDPDLQLSLSQEPKQELDYHTDL